MADAKPLQYVLDNWHSPQVAGRRSMPQALYTGNGFLLNIHTVLLP
jgi:hypothetical protein